MTIQFLLISLVVLILVSGFFSGSETGMMALNRYRLRHMAKKSRVAKRVMKLLERPDRLLGVILTGNTFANLLASSVATVVAVRFFGEAGVLIATTALTLIVLIFAEIAPKTVAALHPERFAFVVSLPLKLLLKILYPIVWLMTTIANLFLRLFGVKMRKRTDAISREELRVIVSESVSKVTINHQTMLLRLIDLEEVCVEDVMIPLSDIYGIDIEEDWDTIQARIRESQHTWIPVYADNIDNVQGVLNLHQALRLLMEGQLNKEHLMTTVDDVYFIPEGTSLTVQLINFRHHHSKVGMVVDEYGDAQGLVSISDILEEIVGDFTTDISTVDKEVSRQKDGSFLVQGNANVRDLNRTMSWKLPVHGPKTLSGLITEELENIPAESVCVRIAGYPIEVVRVKENKVDVARIYPELWYDPSPVLH